MDKLLEVKDLQTSFFTASGQVKAVNGVSFSLYPGEILGLVGESGGGKSVLALSIMGLVPFPGRIVAGEATFCGQDLLDMTEKERERIRGREIAMVFQDPQSSLNPVFSVGEQIMEPLLYHHNFNRSRARNKARELLNRVGITEPRMRLGQYPHQFSGGMRQRVLLAMALAAGPRLLIADEPTSALDMTIQAQILELLKDLGEKSQTSIILITHDLGVVAEICTRVLVMYAGIIVEKGPTVDIFNNPLHPYTQSMIRSLPHPGIPQHGRLSTIPGQPPHPLRPPPGCPFWPRCRQAMVICREEHPPFVPQTPSHKAACWLIHPEAPKVEGGPHLD